MPLPVTALHQASDVLGFDIAEVMFSGSDADLKQTKVTQPAIFLHSVYPRRGHGRSI